MLLSIHINNYTLVESLEIEFSGGTTAITGETGAGKSLVLDALGIALGDRAGQPGEGIQLGRQWLCSSPVSAD